MKISWLTLATVLAFAGCDNVTVTPLDDGGKPLTCPPLPDLSTPAAKCAAAQGLGGTNLRCVDFGGPNAVASLDALRNLGWVISKDMGTGQEQWEITAGKLDIKMFSSVMGSCQFTLPAVSSEDYKKYNSFTLSIIHSLDINKQKQSAAIYLGLDIDAQQIWYSTSTNSRQTTIIKIDKTALPNGGNNQYQPIFKLLSGAPSGGYTGWQIESIALQGNL